MHEIGVLFVHGIGQQTRGQTLLHIGEHLHDWIKRWVAGSDVFNKRERSSDGSEPSSTGASEVTLETVLFEQAPDMTPAHAVIRMRTMRDGNVRSSSWLLAEAFWADSFPNPHFPEVITWTMRVFPWILVSLIIRRLRLWSRSFQGSSSANMHQKMSRLFWAIVQIVASLGCSPFIVVFELVFFILLLTWLIPVPAIRRYLYWLYESFASIIGDSYIFTSSDLRRQAVIDSVRRQMAWLESRCERIAIVAHSQGAAVTYLTLKTKAPDKLSVLFTFGSGLLKLSQLSSVDLGILTRRVRFCLIVSIFLFILLISDWLGLHKVEIWSVLLCVLFLGYLVFFAWRISVAGSWEGSRELADWSRNLESRGVRWVDVFSSADPVPNGPLFVPESADRPRLPHSIRVTNRRSFLMDHTTYPKNMLEFVSLLATTIARDCESSVALHELTSVDHSALSETPLAQQADSATRSMDYWLLGLSAVALLVNQTLLRSLGTSITETFASAFGSVKTVVLGFDRGDEFALWASHGTIGAVFVALGLFVAKQFLDAFFAWRIDRRLIGFFERRPWSKSFRGANHWTLREPLDLVVHSIPALAASVALHSYWPTPSRFFQPTTPPKSDLDALGLQTMIVALLFLLALSMIDMVVLGWFRRDLPHKSSHDRAHGDDLFVKRMKFFVKCELAAIFVFAGVGHFISTDFLVKTMPPYLPLHRELVLLSGVFEIALGVLLLIPKTTRLAAWALMALLIAVFPANVYMFQNAELFQLPPFLLLLPQVILLLPLIWIVRASLYTKSFAKITAVSSEPVGSASSP